MAKKEKDSLKVVQQFLTKMKNMFKKDIWIARNYFVLPGEISKESTPTTLCMCILEPDVRIAITELMGEHRLIYIKDVTKAKNNYENYVTTFDDESTFTEDQFKVFEDIDKITVITTTIGSNWKLLDADTVNDVIDSLYNHSSVYNLIGTMGNDNKQISATIAKDLLPMITAKNINTVKYCFLPTTNGVVMLCFDTLHELFRTYSMYGVINTI